MTKLLMLAAGIVEPGGGHPGAVSAFVAYSAALGKTRLFKVAGPTLSPSVLELDAATTVDLARFRREVEQELAPVVDAIAALGGTAAITQPKAAYVTEIVRRHLWHSEGVETR